MAPKRKPPAQCEGPDKKKGRQGTEEDHFRSTAEALKAAPTEKRTVRVDTSCPLSHKPGAQVSSSPQPGPEPALLGHVHSDLLPSPLGWALATALKGPKSATSPRP